jgi:hypothetical protein
MLRRLMAFVLVFSALALLYAVSFAQDATPEVVFTDLPKNFQLFPRNLATNQAVVPVAGTVETPGQNEVVLRVLREDEPTVTLTQTLVYSGSVAPFSFAPAITAELSNYHFELYVQSAEGTVLVERVDDVVVGDVYLINGQSNAMAYRQRGSTTANANRSSFLRSFGRRDFNVELVMADLGWHQAEGDGYWGPGIVGQWGLRFGNLLIETYQVPVALINGAHGGRAIAFYARNDANPADIETNYGRLLFRAQQAGVAHQVRAMLWYQGEADGTNPNGHENGMIALYDDWLEDYPTLEKIYIHQVRWSTCGTHSIDHRNRQRLLADRLEKVEVMSTEGLDGHDGCHFAFVEGYEKIGEQLFGVVAQDLYGASDSRNVDPPNIEKAYLSNPDEITLVMRNADDTLIWQAGAEADFVVEGAAVTVTAGSIDGNTIRLTLSGDGSSISHIGYWGHPMAGPAVTNAGGVGMLAFRVALERTETQIYLPSVHGD